jgi:hypothetical protein
MLQAGYLTIIATGFFPIAHQALHSGKIEATTRTD